MEVAGIFVSPLLEVLFDKLASRVLLQFATRQGIRSRLEKLGVNLKMITQVITHAEKMLFRQTEVDEWLEELRDWAYDADDFLDEVNTRAMQHEQQRMKEEEEEEEGRRSNNTSSQLWEAFKGTKVRGFLNRRDNVFGFISGKHSKGLDELNSRLDTLSERMHKTHHLMKMTDNTSATPLLPIMLQRPLEATANEFDARVFGREQEKECIIQQLKNSRDANVEVIPIVGMPGLGKTTLARHVFDSMKQQQQQPPLFDIYGWVCVSDDFDVKRITTDILRTFTSRASDWSGMTLNQLQSELKEVVGGKKFLLVLDDVWTRNYFKHWAPLRSPFGVGAAGSKILVTTRDDKVASMMQTDGPMKIHHPRLLCDDACWSVFLKHVTDNISSGFESDAGRFRMQILEKCKGIPLTAKLLAGLLRGESPGQGWAAVLNSSIWDLSGNELPGKGDDGMLPVVMLSYFHLPPKLKPCFSYCAVLPKDYEFGEEEVVSLWMAEGLVLPQSGDEQVEDTGGKYFRELVSRSLFQPSPNSPSRFVMHDLINDMAEIVAGKSCFKLDGDCRIDCSSPAQARYSSHRNFRGLKMEFEAFERTKYLRAFQSFDEKDWMSDFTSYVPLELLMKLKYLRVLCLTWCSVRELPEDMGDLIHLRLVDLSHTYIRRLPESTSCLYNLQALKLKGCQRLRTLPAETRKLVNLRNLDFSGENKMVAMPEGMGNLTSLQKLSNFMVGKGWEEGVGQLKYLHHLKGSISISFLENVHGSEEAREAKLMSKEGLQSVELRWNSDHGDLGDTSASFRVFEELRPHQYLEKLIIHGYNGVSFPSWVGDERFTKMRVIGLANCGKCTSLPPLGKLPVLEEIQIRNMGGIECVGEEFYGKENGAFPSLKILKFEDMENWSIWPYLAGGSCRFACLKELHVINCPKLLLYLPDEINLQKLKVTKCDKLLVALPRQSILEMDVGECRVELMGCLKGDGGQLLPSVTGSLMIEKVDVVEAVGSALMMRMNIRGSDRDVAEAHHPMMMMLGSLKVLEMACIPKLTHLPVAVLRGLPKLEELRIRRCEELTSLWKMDDGGVEIGGFLNSLRVLEVEECCQLVWFVRQRGDGEDGEEDDDTDRDADIIISEEKEEEKRGKKQPYMGLPCGLETLSIKECDKLEKLPSDLLHGLTTLRKLEIVNCRRLSCLPEMGFPSTLESLSIEGCESLTCLSMSSSSMGMGEGNGMPLPHSLKHLAIWRCQNLESLVAGPAFTSADSSLSLVESVEICGCPKLKSLPDLLIHRRLKTLWIVACENLGELSIPVHQLPLETLGIIGWPAGLRSIQQGDPNSNSLPLSIRHLGIGGGGGPMTPNPNDDDEQQLFSVPLPSSLTTLTVSKFKNLSPEAFENLYIWDSPELTSIPDQLLPPSLLSLEIRRCPLLAPKLAKGQGQYWPKVKFIPRVSIDDRSIFDDPEEGEESRMKATQLRGKRG